jgi:predicted short-subunit dehydrogenase-like oxidoreductase (DUF2520 family)
MPDQAVRCPEGPIGIAGAGRMAQAMGRLLRERGEPLVFVAGRDPRKTRQAAYFIGGVTAGSIADLPSRARRVLIAVTDAAIPEVAAILAQAGMREGAALHTCGGAGPEVLAPLAIHGVAVGTIHPLQTVASPDQGVQALPGVAFAIAGDPPAAAWAERIVVVLGGEALRVPAERRPLYHAAAVIAGNYSAGLVDAAVLLMKAAGIEEAAALRAIGPLARSSLANALELGAVRALTGPVQRGDTETIAAHLAALAACASPSVRNLYRAAGLYLLDMARRRGLAAERARAIEALLRDNSESHA